MSKSLIQVANTSVQAVTPAANAPAFVNLGNTIRRYGCNLRLNGNSIEETDEGYYEYEGSITVAPTAAGIVTVGLYENGVLMPGSQVSGSVSTAGNPVTLPLFATSRIACCCNSASIAVGVSAGEGNVQNVSIRGVKS